MKKIEYLIKHNKFIQAVYRHLFSFIFSLFSLFIPLKKNLILISSFSGKRFNDSPKILYDYILNNNLADKFIIVWAFEKPNDFRKFGLNTVKIDSFKYFFTAFRAKYWITNVNIERGLSFKKRNQVYLNTWHGTGPKTIGNAATGRKDYNFKKVNYLCADGEYLKNIFINNFNAKPQSVLLCGRPREDMLYHPDSSVSAAMKSKYKITDEDFVILYAPTWREPKGRDLQSTISIELDVSQILKAIPNAKILFRAHSITTKLLSHKSFDERFISATDEQDIGNLFLISNVLITDYSSSNLDFAILDKPFICFAPDYDDYVKERPLCFDLKKEYPFGVQKSTDDVIKVLNSIINGNCKIDQFKSFKLKYGPCGGDATNVCIKKLFGNISEK